jgi:hypothetical protein
VRLFVKRQIARLAEKYGHERHIAPFEQQNLLEFAVLTRNSLNLLTKMLKPEPTMRIPAADALMHNAGQLSGSRQQSSSDCAEAQDDIPSPIRQRRRNNQHSLRQCWSKRGGVCP